MKLFPLLYRAFVCILLCSLSIVCFGAKKIQTVVLDPGHGGVPGNGGDPGAVGIYSQEKNITLAVCLKLGKLIEENFPDTKVIYTRTTDKAVPLHLRASIANQSKADLFISIHCNSSDTKGKSERPKGFETFTMGLHKNEANLGVAKKENAAILKEKDYMEDYDGFDPSSPDAYIIFTIFQNAHSSQSVSFAQKIQNHYERHIPSVNRGVKQAGFLVLYRCTMPSVLTEIGFINNPDEENFMNSEEGQNKIAQSLFQAFKEYKYQLEGFNNQDEIIRPSKPITIPTIAPEATPSPTYNPIPTQHKVAETESGLIFKVQFASSSTDKDCLSTEFSKLKEVSKREQNGIYKYYSGREKNLENAQNVLKNVQEAGFSDAFIVVYKDGERISTTEAIRILKEQNK